MVGSRDTFSPFEYVNHTAVRNVSGLLHFFIFINPRRHCTTFINCLFNLILLLTQTDSEKKSPSAHWAHKIQTNKQFICFMIRNHHKVNMCGTKNTANGNWPFARAAINLHLHSIYVMYIAKLCRRSAVWIVRVRFTKLNYTKVLAESPKCISKPLPIRRFVGRALFLPVCSHALLDRSCKKKNLCSISFEFIAIINRAIELKSIPKFPRDTRTHHCWQKRCSFRKSNQSNMNIKIPFFVRIRILGTHSSSLCLLPGIFFGECIVFAFVCVDALRGVDLYTKSAIIFRIKAISIFYVAIFLGFFLFFERARVLRLTVIAIQ